MPRQPRRQLIRDLLRSSEPSVRWRTRVNVLGEPRSTPAVRHLEREIVQSVRVRRLLSHPAAGERGGSAGGVYQYWQGIHWVLLSLVELGYPAGEPELEGAIDRSLRLWLRPHYFRSYAADEAAARPPTPGVPVLRGRARRCASQQGAALYYAVKLGFSDARSGQLSKLLQGWQWPDGGWNCDKDPRADTSSFMETLLPMRGLTAYSVVAGESAARRASARAAEVFLRRRLFRRASGGAVIRPDFLQLHYPLYWHYDVLGGLKGLAEVGRIADPRCVEALDWLEAHELSTGGWPAEARYYRVSRTFKGSSEYVDWGQPNRRRANEWVTTDALMVLRAAGRLAA